VITALRSWRVGAFSLVIGVVAGAVLYNDIYGSEGYSLSTRLELLPIMWQIFQANPVFGVGFGNYHFYSQLFAIRGWYVTLNSHNNYVDIFMQTGAIGALAFAWFVWEIVAIMLSLRKRVTDGFSRAYVNGAIGGLTGMLLVGMLGDWFLPFVYNIGLSGFRASVMGWVFLGGIMAIERHYSPAKT
jgi:O-antigen ligase